MRLDDDEIKVKSFFHHFLPFLFFAVKLAIVSLPFYLVATFFRDLIGRNNMFLAYLGITLVFLLVALYESFLYFMDRLVITNKRIVHIEWKNLFNVEESGAEFKEIQDIETSEPGILSRIPLFDYGKFILETAATKTAIVFINAADPEGIKHFIYHLQRKPSRMVAEPPFESPLYDRKDEEEIEEATISGS